MRTHSYAATVAALLPTLAVAIPAGENIFARATCNRDACFRAAVASSVKPGPTSARADCSSFMVTTVTPCPSTVITSSTTTTVTVTSGANAKRDAINLAPRQSPACTPITQSGTRLPPAYASTCSGAPRYSSACSCNGIKAAITTLPASTTSIDTTTTVTATVAAGPPAVTTGAFFVIASDGTVLSTNDIAQVELYGYFYSQISQWDIDPATNYLFENPSFMNVNNGNVKWTSDGTMETDYSAPTNNSLQCSLSNGGARNGGELTCLIPGTTTTGTWCKTNGTPRLLASPLPDNCAALTLRAQLDGTGANASPF